MTKQFDGIGKFLLHMADHAIATHVALADGLERVALRIEKTAKAEFGEYQDETGPFPAWAELADSTKEDRLRKGFSENDPLLRTGELRDSISHETDRHELEAVIGSDSEVLTYMEFGTSKMPPRPVLGPAALRNKDAIERIVGAAAVEGIVGSGMIHQALGYNFETED